MSNQNTTKRDLVQVKAEHNALVLTRAEDIASGSIPLSALDIPTAKYARQRRRADEGPSDINVLAQAILDNTPASQLTTKVHSFLMSMMSYGDITTKQKSYLMDLAEKYLGSDEMCEAA